MSPRMSDPWELKREKHKNGSENVGSRGAKEREAQKMSPRIQDPEELEREAQNRSENVGSIGAKEREAQKCL